MQYSVVNYKTVKENSDFRIDAEYYRQYFFDLLTKISQKKNIILYKISSNKTKRFRGDSDFNYLEISNISTDDAACIYEKIAKEETPSRAQKVLNIKDVVISTVRPNRNAVSFIDEIDSLRIASSGFCVLRNFKGVLPEYIFALFKTYIFRDLLDRETKATMYPAVSEDDILKLKIPIFSINFQNKIAEIVNKLFEKQNKSKSLYSQAEQLLLSELGLLEWKPKHELAFVKNFSDTEQAERFDAEYFQPKYEEIIEAVRKYKGGFDELGNLSKLVGHPSNPPYETENTENKTFIITQKHLANYFPADNFWKDEEALYTTDEFIEKNKKFILQKNDIILYSVGAYIGKANLYNVDIKATIGSFLTLIRPRTEKINPFYLLIFLNSKIGQELTRRNSRGLAQQYIYPYDTKQVIVPILETKIQKEIEKLILDGQKSHNLSKSLLEIAKRGVEIAIEKDEQEAEKWIEDKLKEIKIEI